jgi:uncharacterized protein YceH (UPF0502 family)
MDGNSDPLERPAARASTAAVPELSALEARVLGVLVEKQHTVPDTYPMTLNSLVAGCNQKTSRDPVMKVTETEAQVALDSLRSASLVVESSGERVMRYAHNLERVLDVPSQAAALLATLMLRGPQTVGELRINSDRLHRFADGSAVEAFLHELSGRGAGALVVELPRQPGARENRWAHLLSSAPPAGPARASDAPAAADAAVSPEQFAALTETVRRLERELEALRSELATLRGESSTQP